MLRGSTKNNPLDPPGLRSPARRPSRSAGAHDRASANVMGLASLGEE
jgi:hypothetical protein